MQTNKTHANKERRVEQIWYKTFHWLIALKILDQSNENKQEQDNVQGGA